MATKPSTATQSTATPSTTSSRTQQSLYQGPTRPNTDVAGFRRTGRSSAYDSGITVTQEDIDKGYTLNTSEYYLGRDGKDDKFVTTRNIPVTPTGTPTKYIPTGNLFKDAIGSFKQDRAESKRLKAEGFSRSDIIKSEIKEQVRGPLFNEVSRGRNVAAVVTAPLLAPVQASKLLLTTAKITALGYAGGEAGKLVGYFTAPQSQKEFISNRSQFKEGIQAGNVAEFSTDVSWLRGVAREVSGVRLLAGDKQEFQKGVSTYYSQKGFSESEIKTAVSASTRQRTAGEIGGVAGIFGANVGTELLSPTIKTTGGRIFSEAFDKIAPLGFAEGVAVSVTSSTSRYETPKFSRTATAGVAGAVSAGVIGGGIAQSVKGSTSDLVLKGIAYGGDPYEKIADITAAGISKGAGRLPIMTITPISSRTSTRTSSNPFTSTPNKVNIETTTRNPINTNTPIKTPVSISTPVSVKTPVSVPTTTTTRTSTFITTPTTTSVFTTTPISTPTSTPTTTPTSVPVPTFGQAPLVNPFGGGVGRRGFGNFGFKRTKSYSKYSPSVEANLFNIRGKRPNIITGIGIRPIVNRKKRTTRKKSKRGKR